MSDMVSRLNAALAGRYRIDRELGAGGMATVFGAWDLKHDRQVAIKVLDPHLAAALGADRFLREIKIVAQLSHPNIMPLYDSGEADGYLYYVMPHLEEESLRHRLKRERQLPIEEALRIAREVADALAHAHSRNVVHRDIKPENILLQGGHAVVADFGIARAIEAVGAERMTLTGIAVGTPAYMSPEQASGDRAVDGRSDIYSLACVLYEMVGGEPPYTGPTPQAILARQLTGETRSLIPVRPSVTADLDATIRRALASTAADRFATAWEFAAALEPGTRVAAARHRPVLRAMRAWFTGRRAAAVAVGAVLLFGATVLLRVTVQPGVAVAREQPVALAVFPFRAHGPEAGTLGEGVADLLAAAIDGTGGIHVADPTGLWQPLRQGHSTFETPELSEATRLARGAAAPALVLGSLTATGGRLDITARMYSADGTPRTTVTVSAPAESLSQAVNRLALDVVGRLWERDSLPTVPVIESFATQSIDAMKAYLEAKSLKRRGLFEEAAERLEHAIALDSTFALAHMELFTVRSWTLFLNAQPYTGLREIIDRATQYQDRLTPRNRLRVEAMRALDETDGVRAAFLFQRILSMDSLDVDALHSLAFTYLVDGWQIEKGIEEIIAAYDHLLRVDPGSTVGRVNRVWLGLQAGEPDALARGLETLGTLDTAQAYVRGQLWAFRALAANPGSRDSVLRRMAQEPPPVVLTAVRALRTSRPLLAEGYLDELMADSSPVLHQRIGLGGRTQLWFGEGRIHDNDSVLATGSLDRIRPIIDRYFVNAALAGVGDSTTAARAAGDLAAMPAGPRASALDSLPDGWALGWAVAAYHAAFGDTLVARRWQRALESLPPGGTPVDYRGSLSADIAARLALRRDDLDTAEREARRAYELWGIHSWYASEAEPEPAMRFHLAEILRRRGATQEAEPLYRSLGPPHSWFGFYTARASLALGDIEAARGNRANAARNYLMAVRLWERGEPAIVGPWLAQAREGLRRLGAR